MLILFFVAVVFGQLACYDENGDAVDWFILMKYPTLKTGSSSIQDGYGYSYLDSNSYGSFKKGVTTLDDSDDGALSHTLNKIFSLAQKGGSSFGYAMYNDDAPGDYSDSSYRAHAKGVVAVDDTYTGVWIDHSIPRFPHNPLEEDYYFPEEETTYGQSVLCLSLTGDSMESVGELLAYYMPNYYITEIPSALESMYPNLYDSVQNDHHYTSAGSTSLDLYTNSGYHFLAFGKNKNWDADIYEDLIASTLGIDLLAETWIRDPPLASYCAGVNATYDVINLDSVTFNGYDWTETKDHSKYCFTYDGGSHHGSYWSCVGDINRMTSQFSRGGGAVCYESKTLWGAFDDVVGDFVPC
eukprot:gnl/Chilomastix_cuspidata/363.p1 GENE.gnl/Chilomastix_cuspidata/363~~gnl/Chilomastix_cuspidata/363.p1  ORF type:complete len:354 (+),score=95.71 gnl/Chilomastix_cuspidata/363:37-1098(+)